MGVEQPGTPQDRLRLGNSVPCGLHSRCGYWLRRSRCALRGTSLKTESATSFAAVMSSLRCACRARVRARPQTGRTALGATGVLQLSEPCRSSNARLRPMFDDLDRGDESGGSVDIAVRSPVTRPPSCRHVRRTSRPAAARLRRGAAVAVAAVALAAPLGPVNGAGASTTDA